MTRPILEYENDKPVLKFEVNGVPIVIGFLEKEPEQNTKDEILDMITEQYKQRVCSR